MSLEARAEVLKLARLLGEPPERLAFLQDAAPKDLERLREQVTDVLFDGDAKRLRGLADAARHLPVALLATIGMRAFGPLLCARLTGLLDPERAVAIGRKMDVQFLARLAAEMDPRRAIDVLARMPVETTAAIAAEMARTGEHVAMGRFVGHLSDVALAACVEHLSDADLLRIAFVLDDGLERMARMIGDAGVARIEQAAVGEGLQDEARHVRERLGDKRERR